jgi:PEGA domain-containing protein
MSGCRSIFLIAMVSLLLEGGLVPVAHAEPPTASSVKEAGKHFQRGVTLYNEADYRAALVEFRRAFEIAPNAAVLYNIGQTFYQLQNYASALSTLERYLSESGATAAHRREVEQTIETLQARVGKVAVTTNVADCEVTIDDELVGRTPLSEPVLVSIGRRKVTAMRAGRPPETRFVDVAAGDTVKLTMSLGESDAAPPTTKSPKPAVARSSGKGLVTAGWVTTGVLGAGAITAGVVAFLASRDLKDARDTFPASHDDLTSKSSRVSRFSTIADIAGIAAVVAGGITLTLSLTRSDSHEVHVAVAPNGIQLAGTFK